MSMRRLEAVFARSERALAPGVPIRKTSGGIWVPSPIAVIVEVVAFLREEGLLGAGSPPGALVDAGMGDGRVAAVMARMEPSRTVCGIERDAVLHARAVQNLRKVGAPGPPAVQALAGDYCDVATYASCGLDPRAIGLVVNYPDGNQERLARFVADHVGDGASLCFFTHDHALAIDALVLRARRDVAIPESLDWRISVYRGRPGAAPCSATCFRPTG